MSNVGDENSEFDELDLGGLGPDQPEASDESGALPDLGSTDDLLEPGGETMETGGADGLIQSEEEGLAADAAALAPVEVKEEEKEEGEPEEEEEKGPGLLARLTQTSPYVVLLGISLAAILIGILCLWLELRRYDGEITPPQVGAVVATQSGPPSTTAAA